MATPALKRRGLTAVEHVDPNAAVKEERHVQFWGGDAGIGGRGRLPIEAGKHIVRVVRLAIDPSDRDQYGRQSLLDPAIRWFAQLAMWCVNESAVVRPAMGEVGKDIEAMLQNEAAGP